MKLYVFSLDCSVNITLFVERPPVSGNFWIIRCIDQKAIPVRQVAPDNIRIYKSISFTMPACFGVARAKIASVNDDGIPAVTFAFPPDMPFAFTCFAEGNKVSKLLPGKIIESHCHHHLSGFVYSSGTRSRPFSAEAYSRLRGKYFHPLRQEWDSYSRAT